MTSGGPAQRSRRPQLALAERIARRLNDRLGAVEWVPSDEADVFRLTFCSGLEPRYLKLPIPGTRVVAREVVMLPALRARGFPVLEFEHSTDDLAGAGTAFHTTREVPHVTGAELVASDPSAGSKVSTLARFPAACAGTAIQANGGGPSTGRCSTTAGGRRRLAGGPSASWHGWTRRRPASGAGTARC